MPVPRLDLTPDYSISRVIKGHWQLSDGHKLDGSINLTQAITDMHAFTHNGITTFDVADIYTGAEEAIGAFRKAHPDALNQVHTKYVPDKTSLSKTTRQDVETIIDRSLLRLNMDRLDLVQFHWWDYQVPHYIEVASYLQELVTKGKIRHLGVTNFNTTVLKELCQSGIPIRTTQNQYSLLDRRPEKALTALCEQYDMHILCYGTLAGGFLSNRWLNTPEPELPTLPNRSLVKYKLIIDEAGGWEAFQNLIQQLNAIAQSHQVGIAEVASAYILTRPHVGGVIVGVSNNGHLAKTLQMAELQLTPDDLRNIEQAISSLTPIPGDTFDIERDDPKHSGIMKTELNKST